MYILLIALCLVSLFLCIFFYLRTSRILKSLDDMLERAISGSFSEKSFDESRLSKLEAKMHRYISEGASARKKLAKEHDSIKALVSDISHQTKTPIANISLYTELLEEKELDEGSAKLLHNIKEQSDKLSFLIRSLVKLSRLENGILSLKASENSIDALFKTIDFSALANEKGVTLTLSDPSPLTAHFDLKWTSEAIGNIIDNAVKYTPQGGFVKVSAKKYEMFVRIDIEDSGIGIGEEDTAKIFTRFYRSSEVTDERGIGLGLYLAREIISREGGYIKIRSEKGKGSVFSVFLPR